MRMALREARKGLGRTSPNPCVGAVVVKNGRVLGKGWHRAAGLPHAEVEAVRDAEHNGHSVRGATLYVTLEPCSTWGRTPPCAGLIVEKGIRHVVAGATDPNPRHRGKGLHWLKKMGVRVTDGVLERECLNLNRGWNHWIVNRTPWVIAKCGMTLDGKIATAQQESKWITGAGARQEAQRLRSRVDAILVGINTVLADDPSLTVRLPGYHGKQPWRVALDAKGRIPLKSRLVQGNEDGRTWIFVSKNTSQRRVRQLLEQGIKVSRVNERNGRLNVAAVLKGLGDAGIVNLLVEGGGGVLGSFLDEQCIHEVCLFVAPMILGGKGSVKAFGGKGVLKWSESAKISECQVFKIKKDLIVKGFI